MAGAAVLLPVRLETRFDDVGGTARMRIIVVPDRCWFDRHHGATKVELDLLDDALRAAGGALMGGQALPEGGRAEAAFAALARSVGPGRALWLARAFPPQQVAALYIADRDAGLRHAGPQRTAIRGLPGRIDIIAEMIDGARVPVTTLEPRSDLVLSPEHADPASAEDDVSDEANDPGELWWPQWPELDRVGLAAEITPSPIDPLDVAALYAIGVGETSAADVFRHHLDVGDLAVLRGGQPTNTVAGEPTVDLGLDAAAWRRLTVRGPATRDGDVALAVTGKRAGLDAVLGGDIDEHQSDLHSVLIDMLFPGLAGHHLREHWSMSPETVEGIRVWARDNIRPSGPIAPIRIGRQPYGVWPVAPWSRWTGPGIEGPAVEVAARLSHRFGSVGLGTVEGADHRTMWELLAQTPTSMSYDLRAGLALPLVPRIWSAAVGDGAADEFARRIMNLAAETFGEESSRLPVPIFEPWPIQLGFVLPVADDGTPLPAGPWDDEDDPDLATRPAEWIVRCCERLLDAFGDSGLTDFAGAIVDIIDWFPGSLWWRLTVLSGMVALDHAVREEQGDVGPLPDGSGGLSDRIAQQQLTGTAAWTIGAYDDFRTSLIRLVELCAARGDDIVGDIERALAGLLDTCSHRVDPWLTGAAWRRLRTLEEDRPLGLYGWIDGPLDGEPGPDLATGAHLTPSYPQARLAAILRDKSTSDDDEKWDLDITSARTRAAVRLGDDVRAGAHAAEAVGREVERLIGERSKIDAVRREFGVRPEHAGRRTCDGLAVVDVARNEPIRLSSLGIGPDTISAIGAIVETIDTFADLLIVEAVDHAISGRPAAAAASLDAAAGLGLPPDLRALSTPDQGRSVRTTVLTVLPQATGAAGHRSPLVRANPSLASWVANDTPDVSDHDDHADWTFRVDGEPSITLTDLGYHPADALLVDDLAAAVRLSLGLDATTLINEPRGVTELRSRAPAVGTRPPTSSDIDIDIDTTTDLATGPALATALEDGDITAGHIDAVSRAKKQFDRMVARRLIRRLAATRLAARRLGHRLAGASNDAARIRALVDAARWGIAPPQDGPDGEGRDLDAAIENASDVIAARIAATADVMRDEPASIVEHIHRLVGRTIPLAVEIPPRYIALTPDAVDADGRSQIDSQWLEVVAAVRPPLARLEAFQHQRVLTTGDPFVAASTHPGVPWLKAPDEVDDRTVPHLITAYGPDPLPLSAGAWAVLDSFAETVPTTARTAGLAMRFNAPGAQPPNAILVAVTPEEGVDVESDIAFESVVEARMAARSRVIRQEDLAALDGGEGGLGFISGPWLPAFERGGFQWRARATDEDWRES